MFDAIKLPAAAAAGAAGGALLMFLWTTVVTVPNARQEARLTTQSEARTAVFNQLKERDLTNAAVGKMSDGDRCKLAGGVFANGECT